MFECIGYFIECFPKVGLEQHLKLIIRLNR